MSAAQPTGPHVMQAAEIRALQQHHELRQRLKHDVVVPVWQHEHGSERVPDGPMDPVGQYSMGLQRHSRVRQSGIRIADWPGHCEETAGAANPIMEELSIISIGSPCGCTDGLLDATRPQCSPQPTVSVDLLAGSRCNMQRTTAQHVRSMLRQQRSMLQDSTPWQHCRCALHHSRRHCDGRVSHRESARYSEGVRARGLTCPWLIGCARFAARACAAAMGGKCGVANLCARQ